MSISNKAGYNITEEPLEPTSLFGSENTEDVSDAIVTFSEGDNSNLVSGSTVATLFGKIKYFIRTFNQQISNVIFATASVDSNVGTPSVEVTKTVDNGNTTFNFAFHI